MIRRSINKLLAVGFAAAALTSFGAPAQAAEAANATPSVQGWCDRLPLFCENRCGNTYNARCNPPPT